MQKQLKTVPPHPNAHIALIGISKLDTLAPNLNKTDVFFFFLNDDTCVQCNYWPGFTFTPLMPGFAEATFRPTLNRE